MFLQLLQVKDVQPAPAVPRNNPNPDPAPLDSDEEEVPDQEAPAVLESGAQAVDLEALEQEAALSATNTSRSTKRRQKTADQVMEKLVATIEASNNLIREIRSDRAKRYQMTASPTSLFTGIC